MSKEDHVDTMKALIEAAPPPYLKPQEAAMIDAEQRIADAHERIRIANEKTAYWNAQTERLNRHTTKLLIGAGVLALISVAVTLWSAFNA